jgi:hypothetical protein
MAFMALVAGGCSHGGASPGTSRSAGAGIVIPPNYVVVTPVVKMSPIRGAAGLPASSVLGGPNFAVYLSEVATVDHIDPEWVRQSRLATDLTVPWRAPPNHEFVLARLSDVPALGQWHPRSPWSEVTADVVIGGTPRRLAEPQSEGAVLIATVAKGAPVRLEITDQGRTQSIDVRTGAVGPDAVAEYTVPPPSGRVRYDVPVVPRPNYLPRVDVTVELSATVRPFDGRQGGAWAAPGRGWLLVSLKVTFFGYERIAGTLDLPASLRLQSGATALAVPAMKSSVGLAYASVTDYVSSSSFPVDVPVGLRTVAVSFEPKGSFTYDGAPLTYRVAGPTSATLTLS